MCVCVSSQVYNKLQMVYREALRSLTHIPPSMPTSHCVVKLYPWHVFCISHSKIALAETQERLKCSGEANQAASERQQSKRDFKQLPLLWVREKNNNKRSLQFGNQSSVRYQEEGGRKEGWETEGRTQGKRELPLFVVISFHSE